MNLSESLKQALLICCVAVVVLGVPCGLSAAAQGKIFEAGDGESFVEEPEVAPVAKKDSKKRARKYGELVDDVVNKLGDVLATIGDAQIALGGKVKELVAEIQQECKRSTKISRGALEKKEKKLIELEKKLQELLDLLG